MNFSKGKNLLNKFVTILFSKKKKEERTKNDTLIKKMNWEGINFEQVENLNDLKFENNVQLKRCAKGCLYTKRRRIVYQIRSQKSGVWLINSI